MSSFFDKNTVMSEKVENSPKSPQKIAQNKRHDLHSHRFFKL